MAEATLDIGYFPTTADQLRVGDYIMDRGKVHGTVVHIHTENRRDGNVVVVGFGTPRKGEAVAHVEHTVIWSVRRPVKRVGTHFIAA